ncbi:MAG: hypothetical protein E7328_05180 [Clostridiales bacterium]|nr:hypothetical protein [Clostridiales bacterium]
MNVIDVHLHFFERGDGNEGPIRPRVQQMMKDAGVALAIAMGSGRPEYKENPPRVIEPLLPYMDEPLDLDNYNFLPNTAYCAGINPNGLCKENLKASMDAFAKALKTDHCVGLKVYAGYQFFYVNDPIYHPFYELAEHYNVPVVIHTGDTANPAAKVKYSHPLTVDDAAVDFPRVQFVMAHYGNPFIIEATEVAKKNPNVSIDLSGMAVGEIGPEDFSARYGGYVQHLRTWMAYLDAYEKLMYGTDWPLADMQSYLRLMQSIVPEQHHKAVFYENALRVFKKINPLLNQGE